MAETHHKKQQITAALTALRIQMQNEASLLRRQLDMKTTLLGIDQKSSVGMGQLRSHFRLAAVWHSCP